MEFRACCCLKPRTGALLTGILDTLIGLFGVLGIACIIFGGVHTMSPEADDHTDHDHMNHTGHEAMPTTTQPPTTTLTPTEDNNNNNGTRSGYSYADDVPTATYLYAFSALTTLLLGIILLLAAWKKNAGLAKAALVLNLLNVVGTIAGTVGLFVLGIHWHLLFPMPIAIILQIYFLWIVFDYQKYFNYSQPLNVKPRA